MTDERPRNGGRGLPPGTSRRKVLGGLGAIALGGGLGRTAHATQGDRPDPLYPTRTPVLVIGAGLAGLNAAWTLKKAGIPSIVLEASDQVGGRMTTVRREGWAVEPGVKLLSRTYRAMMPLVKELGLSRTVGDLEPLGRIVKGGTPRPLHWHRDATLHSGGILGRDSLRYMRKLSARLAMSTAHLSFNEPGDWKPFDLQTADRWCDRYLTEEFKEFLVEPLYQGLFFQDPEEASQWIMEWIMVHQVRGAKFQAFTGGMLSLPERLAGELDVRLGVTVHSLAREQGGVVARTDQGEFRGEQAVLAVRGDLASALYSPANSAEAAVMEVRYAPAVHVAYRTSKQWRDNPETGPIYGLLVPRKERDVVAAVTLASGRPGTENLQGEVVEVLPPSQVGREMLGWDDQAIADRFLPELERYFPGIGASTTDLVLNRWPAAIPVWELGRSVTLERYRESAAGPVCLAGDYTCFPSSDAALASGSWAARRLLAQQSKRSLNPD